VGKKRLGQKAKQVWNLSFVTLFAQKQYDALKKQENPKSMMWLL